MMDSLINSTCFQRGYRNANAARAIKQSAKKCLCQLDIEINEKIIPLIRTQKGNNFLSVLDNVSKISILRVLLRFIHDRNPRLAENTVIVLPLKPFDERVSRQRAAITLLLSRLSRFYRFGLTTVSSHITLFRLSECLHNGQLKFELNCI